MVEMRGSGVQEIEDLSHAMLAQIAQMNQSMERDALTGIYGREAFYRRAAALMQENSETPYRIVCLDIRAFKVLNGQYHQEMGDLILQTAALFFARTVGEMGLCARIESDHFALCAERGALDMDALIAGVDDVMKRIGIAHAITFYAGVYDVHDVYRPVARMYDHALMAMDTVKGSRRARYAYYDKAVHDRLALEQMIVRDMAFALQAGQFCVYLQPIFDLAAGRITGAEALVRWNHPTGMISPGAFIPVFEKNGFIVQLDRFVWREVCRLLHEQKEQTGHMTPVSVNVSWLNFYNRDLLDYLKALAAEYALEPRMLMLEVTERSYKDNPQQLIGAVEAFRDSGFPVLLDDFGEGYASLEMLAAMPVDTLKIDFASVQAIRRQERIAIIFAHVMKMARALDMRVIVEGVETEEQVAFLRTMGCEKIQGYYFAPPLAEADYFARLAAGESGQAKESACADGGIA